MIWLVLTFLFLLLVSLTTKIFYRTFGILTLICFLFGVCLNYFYQVPPLKVTYTLSQVSLIFFLFIDGIRLHFPKIIHYHREAFQQMTFGLFIQILLGILLARYFLSLPWIASCMLALPFAAIDGRAIPTSLEMCEMPSRISQILNLESSATPLFTVTLFTVFNERSLSATLFPLLLGCIFGICVVYLAQVALKVHLAHPSFLSGSLFIAPFALFYLCDVLHWNGYIGVIALSLTLGHVGRSLCIGLFDFGRRQGKLLFFLFIILFGSHILTALTYPLSLTWKMVCFALLSLFVIRAIGVFVSFSRSGFRWRTFFFCSFFGPRVFIPAALAVLFFSNAFQIYSTLCMTVSLSLLIHTLFSFVVAFWYSRSIQMTQEGEFLPTIAFPQG